MGILPRVGDEIGISSQHFEGIKAPSRKVLSGWYGQAQRHHTLVRRPETRNLEKQRLVETQAGTDLFG